MNKFYVFWVAMIFVIPITASAVWWNPASWFEKNSNPPVEAKIETKENTEVRTEPINETATEQRPRVQEKIIEKTITVDNPELQKKINDLLKQNSDLQLKVNSLTSSLNSCKVSSTNTTPQTSTSEYSDFNFTYSTGVSKITFPFSTSRDIVIKKAVFHIKETGSKDLRKVGSIQRLEVSTSTASKPLYYNLENNGSTFTFLGTGIPLKGKETMVINVSIANSSGAKETETFYMVPDFSQWEIWDNTTDKPVRIN